MTIQIYRCTHVPLALGASRPISNSHKCGCIFLKTGELRAAVFAPQFRSRRPWPVALPQQRLRIIEIQSRGISMRCRKNGDAPFLELNDACVIRQ